MDTADIKNQMMKLWKDTFHDSDDYINLIFDNYFNTDYIAYHIKNEKIVSAMLGVPYSFKSKNNPDLILKGLYLCGLATTPEERGSGIMTKLIEEINIKAEKSNFDFTFLIPASDGLIKYYSDRGYAEAVYRIKNQFLSSHNFRNEYITSLISSSSNSNLESGTFINYDEVEKRFPVQLNYYDSTSILKIKNPDSKLIKTIASYISRFEESQSFFMLAHTPDDIRIAIVENQISGGEVIIAINQEKEIIGVSFLTRDDDDNILVPYSIFDDIAVKYRMLSEIKNISSLPTASNIEDVVSHDSKHHSKYPQSINHPEEVSSIKTNRGELSKEDCDEIEELSTADNHRDSNTFHNCHDHGINPMREDNQDINGDRIAGENIQTIGNVTHHNPTANINNEQDEISKEKDDTKDGIADNLNRHQIIKNEGHSQSSACSRGRKSFVESDKNASGKGRRDSIREGMNGADSSAERLHYQHRAEKGSVAPAPYHLQEDPEQDFTITCFDNPYLTNVRAAIWSPLYISGDARFSTLSAVAEVESPLSKVSRVAQYAMIRLLNPRDILKFRPSVNAGEKYPILAVDYICENEIKIATTSGDYIVNTQITNPNNRNCGFIKAKDGVKITLKQLSDILFRRPGSSKLAEEVLGLPEIPIFLGLMLD